MNDYIAEYYERITDGTIIAGEWIKRLYTKLTQGLKDGLYKLDLEKANNAIEWIETHCFHVEGPLAPNTITLELWQKALISCIFGICDENGLRQFREVVLIIARKNGKSLLASAIANYVLRVDGGYGCRVYNIAPKLEQAEIVYMNTWAMISLDPDQRERKKAVGEERKTTHQKVEEDPEVVKKRMSDLFYPKTNSTMKKISASEKRSDGFNPSLCICDEVASWEGDKGLKTYEVMKSGMGARPESLMLSCTTSGYINDSIYDELLKRSTRLLLGDSNEKRLLPFLYMIDDIGKWDDIEEIKKANPNIDKSVTQSYIEDEIEVAHGSLSKKAEFITKYCCLKQTSSLAWLGSEVIETATGEPLNLEDFRGCYCVGGVDLSRTTDLTAACVVIERDGEFYIFSQFWLPSERIEELTAIDGVPYNIYAQRGLLRPSGANIIEYSDVFGWFKELVERYEIYPLKVGYDKYSAQYFVQQMDGYGFHMDDVYQGYNLHPAIVELEGLLKDGKVHIGDNDLMKIHMFNSALKISTEKGRSKLVKIKPTAHIDGMAAVLDALIVRQKWFGDIGAQLTNGNKEAE